MLSPAALALSAVGGVCALAACSYVVPTLYRHRTLSGVTHIPLGEYLSFDARVRWTSLLLWASGVSSALEVLPDVADVAPSVIRILGQNPSRMTLRGTNTYLVGSGSKRILIDTSDGNAKYMETLLRVCREAGVREITDVLLTHGHYDHMGGILRVKEAFPNVRVWKYLPQDDKTLRVTNAECALLGVAHLQDGVELPVPSPSDDSQQSHVVLRAVYTPGHYNDHMCFFLEDKATGHRALFSGDCVLGFGSCVFDSLKELMSSLALLQAQNPHVIYPGHGPVVHDAKGKIHEYISHREQREGEVLAALEAAAANTQESANDAGSPSALSSAQIVSCIYPKLPFALQLAARKAVDKHLHKLLLDERVVKTPSGWFAAATYHLVPSAPRANL
ncbi:Beta-lactamase-like protein [Globisporangium polare]